MVLTRLQTNALLPHITAVICLQLGTKCFVNTLAAFQHVALRVNKTSSTTRVTSLTELLQYTTGRGLLRAVQRK